MDARGALAIEPVIGLDGSLNIVDIRDEGLSGREPLGDRGRTVLVEALYVLAHPAEYTLELDFLAKDVGHVWVELAA